MEHIHFFVTFALAVILSVASTSILGKAGWGVGMVIVLMLVLIGVFFDIMGLAAAAAKETPFHAMAAEKVRGAKQAIYIVRNADRFSNFCNDVIGDMTGVISGSATAIVVTNLLWSMNAESVWMTTAVSVAFTGLVSALTVGGKALGKSFAIHYSTSIVLLIGKCFYFWRPSSIFACSPRNAANRNNESEGIPVLLEQINQPSDLKRLTKEELPVLAEEIRQFLIEKLAVTGGHLASNLGVVELTLVLHYLYDSPRDKMIFDVGHQAYVHKILTGRKDRFDSLRQYKGLCGFVKRAESEHDVWEAGHSSTSLSAAMGMALSRDFKGESNKVIAVIGDGALTGGMALEALNHIGHEKKNLMVVLNDNEMSIAPNVGALHNYLCKIRSDRNYLKAKEEVEQLLKRFRRLAASWPRRRNE